MGTSSAYNTRFIEDGIVVQNLNRTNVRVVANALKGSFESAEYEITGTSATDWI